MALCFTHTAAGYAVYEAARPAGPHRPGLALAAIVLANAPDLDFLPGFLVGHPGLFHRGVTHTLGGLAIVAAVVWLLARRRVGPGARSWRVVGFAAAAWASHLVVDYVSTDAVPPQGAQFLWPFSDAYWIAPRPIFPEIVIDMHTPGRFFETMLAPKTLPVWSWEIGTLVTTVALVHAVRALVAMAQASTEEVAERPSGDLSE